MKNRLIPLLLISLMLAFLVIMGRTLIRGEENSLHKVSLQTANSLYQRGHYLESAQVYEQILATGHRNEIVYFNLGNAYLQSGEYGRAILNLERAARLSPRDSDVRHNLAIAQKRAGITAHSSVENPLASLSEISQDWFNLNEHGWVALSVWILFASIILLRLSFPKGKRPLNILIVGLAIILLVTSLSLAIRIITQSDEVIITAEGTQLYQAKTIETQATNLPVGSSAKIQTPGKEWSYIVLQDHVAEGWILNQSFDSVIV